MSRLWLTREQVENFFERLGKARASAVLTAFHTSYCRALDSGDVEELYDERYRQIIRDMPASVMVRGRFKIHGFNRFAFDRVLGLRVRSVLEIGCGAGDFVLALACSGISCAGIDLSCDFIAEAGRRAEDEGLDVDLRCADAAEVSDLGSFDCVVMNDVVEHLSDRELGRILPAVKRALKPEGELLIHTPNGLAPCNDTESSFVKRVYMAYLKARGRGGFERTPEQFYYAQTHINVKGYPGWRRLLARHGFGSRVIYDERSASLPRRVILDPVTSGNMLIAARPRP
jgi:2-polyprenyl-3-methyl-5-hydroxy-6-metoxy-1,4-benzoquinol methylase